MKDSIDERRRRLIFAIAPLAVAAPFLMVSRSARADLPIISEDDQAAQSLNFSNDAYDVPVELGRVDGAACSNCMFSQGFSGNYYAPCGIFPGYAVPYGGWCMAWAGAC